jgi:hypothetical protein
MNLFFKKNYIHLLSLAILSINYILPLIFIGQVAVDIHDNLDSGTVYDHIISRIYKGETESINYFLSGEIKWYYLEKIFYPINLLQYVLNDKYFFFTDTIFKILIAYFSFYLLAKSLKTSKINSAIGGILFASIIHFKLPLTIGMAALPYILYLLINKKKLSKKHYFILFFIGVNSSLVQDIFSFFFMIPLSFLLKESVLLKDRIKNYNVFFQIYSIILISLILTGIHIVIGSFSELVSHREAFIIDNTNSILIHIIDTFKKIYYGLQFSKPLYFFDIPLALLVGFLLILSIFSYQKKIKSILFFIIFIFILKLILGTNFIHGIFLETLKGYNFLGRVDRVINVTYSLLFIFLLTYLKNKNLKILLYILSFITIISIQVKTPLPVITEIFLKNNMNDKKFAEVKQGVNEKKYIEVIKTLSNLKNYQEVKNNYKYVTNKTFDNYYKFHDYAYIKSIVKDSRVMSVGLDPMIAVMNNIKVIDGYHNLYPLEYKINFRKIIEKELEKNIKLKKYYDEWGSRVYAFYNDENNLELNFQSAKQIGADYIISRFPINNHQLKIVCYKCNKSKEIFLYKIL